MQVFKKPIFYYYLFALLLVGAMLYMHLSLKTYSYRDKELVTALTLLQDSSKINTGVFDSNLINNLGPQLECASDEKINWLRHFKQDSLAYPANIVSYTFNCLLKLDVRLIRMEPVGKTMQCELLVKDKNQFKVTIVFVKQGNKYLLYNIENLCALYKRLACHLLYAGG